MAKDESDFMLTEYDHISTAYFGLQNQVNEWFKSYLTIIGIPITILVGIMRIFPSENEITISTMPEIFAWLLFVVAFLGLFVTISIISMRMEMIMYARTINLVRRYFAEKSGELHNFLVLPKTDTKPGFFELKDTTNWQVVIMALINSVLMFGASVNIARASVVVALISGIFYFMFHGFIYFLFSYLRERNWNKKIPKDLGKSNY